MRDDHIDLCGQVDFTRTEAMPLLEREAQFCFACAGCGDCCRGREDIVLSGFDLWRIAARLRLPPQIVARGYCRASIGQVSHLPVLRLAPVKENRSNCPFLTENHCAIHDAEPLVCALYPLAQEISREGQVSYFLQPTGCGGQVIEARVQAVDKSIVTVHVKDSESDYQKLMELREKLSNQDLTFEQLQTQVLNLAGNGQDTAVG